MSRRPAHAWSRTPCTDLAGHARRGGGAAWYAQEFGEEAVLCRREVHVSISDQHVGHDGSTRIVSGRAVLVAVIVPVIQEMKMTSWH